MTSTGLMASTALAVGNVVSVTLPESASVSNTTLAREQYKMREVSLASTQSIFVLRDYKRDTAAMVIASKTANSADVNMRGGNQKTEVVLSPGEGRNMRLGKMFR